MSHLNKPDYAGGSIVNLMSSVASALGADATDVPQSKLLPADQLSSARNIIFIVVDGLGYNYLTHYVKDNIFTDHLQGSLTSVFPTTTASAITSYFTCLTPLQHGLTGWYMYLKEMNDIVTVLPFKPRGSPVWKRLDKQCKEVLYNFQSVFDRIKVPSYIVTQKNIVDSVYSLAVSGNADRLAYRELEEMFVHIKNTISLPADQKYIYSYWSGFDAISHQYGVQSTEALSTFRAFENLFDGFIRDIKGTNSTVIVTADHGFIDTEPSRVIRLEDHPDLQDTLVLPLCGEPRVIYCYVDKTKKAQFENYIKKEFADYCQMYKSEELVRQGYFGTGKPCPGFADRIGDYVLIMKENYVLKDTLPTEKPFTQIGVHGGLSDDELYVPLIKFDV